MDTEYYTPELFSWNVIHFDKSSMSIQMSFNKPIEVSSGSTGRDLVLVSFEDTRLVYDFVGQELEQGTLIK